MIAQYIAIGLFGTSEGGGGSPSVVPARRTVTLVGIGSRVKSVKGSTA